jgi:hypothetical protein
MDNDWDFPLNRWRETSILGWRKILEESKLNGDAHREEYARKMLVETLETTEIEEENNKQARFI